MTKPRTSSTIKNDPFSTVIPMPTDHNAARVVATSQERVVPVVRAKLTIHLPEDIVNRVKNAAYWNPRLTISKIVERGVTHALEEVERDNGGPYKQREQELTGGRPMK
jgi:hypothetical protein